jgi:protein-tyrosine kinase
MDRIRKALDRARVERTHADVGAARAEPVAVAEEQAKPRGVAAGVTYHITKAFSPEDEHLERNRIMRPAATGAAPAAYRMLRTQVLQRMDAQGWRSLAVFSPGPNDGKTTTAVNLAVSLASDRLHTVLLVDFDFKRPMVASCFGHRPEFGVDDVLAGNAGLQDCLYHPQGFERLVLLPARATLGNSSEVLAGPRAREIVAEIRGRYRDRIIVFDLPPV